MVTLIIETSTDKGFVALARGRELLSHTLLPTTILSSKVLFQEIKTLLDTSFYTAADVTQIGVGVGPGGYTGIRVGVAAAKGLAFPRKLPLFPLCSLSGFVSLKEGKFASLIDAKMGGYYVLLQERRQDIIIPLSSPAYIPLERLEEHLVGCEDRVGPHRGYPNLWHIAYMCDLQSPKSSVDVEICYLSEPSYQRRPPFGIVPAR